VAIDTADDKIPVAVRSTIPTFVRVFPLRFILPVGGFSVK